jgi:hypothetical protein
LWHAGIARCGSEGLQREPARGVVRVALKHGLVSVGAAQVRRERARGGVRELVECNVAARAGASGTQRTGVQALGGRRTGGANSAETRVRARE